VKSAVSIIRAALDKDNTQVFRTIGEVQEELTGEQRETWLDEAAERIAAHEFATIRAQRNALLGASDWTQVADAPVDAKAWAKYRQELRDLPKLISDPTQPVTWPSPPE
jgi:hypothetical protein